MTRIGETSAARLGAPDAAPSSTSFDGQTFMRLLVAQIRNQDPLAPMDTTAMMGQLAQLAEVERLVAIDERLGSLTVATASMANAQATDLVGRTVEADTSHILLPAFGDASSQFELGGPAETVRVQVYDATGRVVRTMELGSQAPGAVSFAWDGRDDSGARLGSGRYRITIQALDGAQREVAAEPRLRGVVSAVSYENGFPELVIGGARVLLGDVRSVTGGERESEMPEIGTP
jgi:flagellar basal-body rod modification protein FlgD